MPKTVDIRRHCEEELEHATIFCNPQKLRCRDWVVEDYCMLSLLLAVPSCIYSFWHGVIPTSDLILYLIALTVARGEMILHVVRATRIALACTCVYVRMHMRIEYAN